MPSETEHRAGLVEADYSQSAATVAWRDDGHKRNESATADWRAPGATSRFWPNTQCGAARRGAGPSTNRARQLECC